MIPDLLALDYALLSQSADHWGIIAVGMIITQSQHES